MIMKLRLTIIPALILSLSLLSCSNEASDADLKIAYLHHSTGEVIWNGKKESLPDLFKQYNKESEIAYYIKEINFPKASPYGWNNYPFDYYNIWVKNGDKETYMEEPTLESLTKEYQVIIFKHCFPVSNVLGDDGMPDIDSDKKTLANYKLQYDALKNKLHEYSDTKFILFTGAALTKASVSEAEATLAKEFFEWVKIEWDQPGDNIYIWDLHTLQTQGGLYFKDEYAVTPTDSHPNKDFAGSVVKLLFNRIIDVITNNGTGTSLTGEKGS